MTTFTRIRSALPTDDAALRADIEAALAEAEQRAAAGGDSVRLGDHVERLSGLLDHRKTTSDAAEREAIDRSIRVTLRRLTWADSKPARAAQTAAPAPTAATRPTKPAATTPSRTATTAPSSIKAPPAADPAPATARHPDFPVAAPAAGPLAAEIEAGERALASGRAAVIGNGAPIERARPAQDFTAELAAAERALAAGRAKIIGHGSRIEQARPAQDFTAELAAADRALAAGRAKIIQGGAASFPRPEPEPVETASRPLVERAKAQWDRDPGLRAEFGYRFDMFLAYRRQAERQAARAGAR